MTVIVKVLRNTKDSAFVKIKSDVNGGTAQITKEMLCYLPQTESFVIDMSDQKTRFGDYNDNSSIYIRGAQWSGFSQEGAGARIYRGLTLDLEHLVISCCVGDTCQCEFYGQEMPADWEYKHEDITVECHGEMVIWLNLRKSNFSHYWTEYSVKANL